MKNKKKAFTLTELLVVVIVIGVLSAAVLPKFSKVIETRKTTEAEELMASIRTEQEKRCALDKQYITDDISRLNDIVKNPDTKNYEITLQGTGVIASSKGNYSYTLEMPSYLDGRICCRGNDCEKLNKNYPNCDEGFTYEPSPESCAGTIPPVEPEIHPCTGSDTQACGCQNKGTQSRTCNTTTGEWSDWGACSISDSCECTGEKKDRQACTAGNTCGFETRTATCDASTGEWEYGAWNKSGCTSQPTQTSKSCSSCGGMQSITYTCNKDSGSWDSTFGDCDKPEEECDDCVDGREIVNDYYGDDTCDGDKINQYVVDRMVLSKFECYDVYSVGEDTEWSGSYTCGDALIVCEPPLVRRCIKGKWKCQNPEYDDCPGGICNEQPGEPGHITSVGRQVVAKVTICGRGGAIIDGPIDIGTDLQNCTLGGTCTSVGFPGKWIKDAKGRCCCQPDCHSSPNSNGLACVAPNCLTTYTGANDGLK